MASSTHLLRYGVGLLAATMGRVANELLSALIVFDMSPAADAQARVGPRRIQRFLWPYDGFNARGKKWAD
jgi:hypothetical protein